MRRLVSKMLLAFTSSGSASVLAVAAALTLTAPAVANQTVYNTHLSGSSEVPPNASTGSGAVTVTIDFDLLTMRVQTAFSNVLGNVTAAHIHCCAPPGTNVGVATVVPTFTGFPSGVTSGTYDHTFDMALASSYNAAFITNNGGTASAAFSALVAGMNTGKAYFNIHTTSFPGGEIRGSLLVAPTLQSAVSRKVHGAAGTFDLPLSLVSTNPTTEPRQGPAQTIVFTFDKPANAATVVITGGSATAGAPTFSGNDVIIGLAGVANEQYVTVSLTNVASTDGGTGGSGSVRLGFLLGDVNGTRVVSLADLGLVNAQLSQLVTAANYLKDVNASGTLTLADKGITNANLTKALPAP